MPGGTHLEGHVSGRGGLFGAAPSAPRTCDALLLTVLTTSPRSRVCNAPGSASTKLDTASRQLSTASTAKTSKATALATELRASASDASPRACLSTRSATTPAAALSSLAMLTSALKTAPQKSFADAVRARALPGSVSNETQVGRSFVDSSHKAFKNLSFPAMRATLRADKPSACSSLTRASHFSTNVLAVVVSSGLQAHSNSNDVAVGRSCAPHDSQI